VTGLARYALAISALLLMASGSAMAVAPARQVEYLYINASDTMWAVSMNLAAAPFDDSGDADYFLGLAQEGRGRVDEALESLGRAHDDHPENQAIAEALARVRAKRGK